MGNIFTFFNPRHGEMTPDQALEILYTALTGQSPAPIEGSGYTPFRTGPTFNEWCRLLNLPRHKLDRYIRQTLGYSGEELVDAISSRVIKKEDALADIPLGFF